MNPEPALPTPDAPSSGGVIIASYRRDDVLRAGNQAFRLVKCLGLGAMGEVYEVDDQSLGVRRVLKLLRPDLARSAPHLVKRFSRESRCLAKLRHPSCVSVILADCLGDGTPFYVMEFVAGRSLAAFVAKHAPLEPRVALPILLQVASALEAVHAAGIIHRDIKTDNLLIWREESGIRATLLDFGVMKLVADVVHEGFCGTPKFAAPEQLLGLSISVKIDIFALGLVAFQMLTRHDAYEDFDSPLDRVKRPAPLLSDTGGAGGVSDPLTMLVADMLALDPSKRPTARQVADRLMACPEAMTEGTRRPVREDEITNEELMSISPLMATPIHPADLEAHTMPGAPSFEIMEAARRALSATVRGQTTPGVAPSYSDNIQLGVAETQISPGRADAKKREDAFDIHAQAMAIAQRVALRQAMTRSIALSGLPPQTERLDGSSRPGVSELLQGIQEQWQLEVSPAAHAVASDAAPVTRASAAVGFALPAVGPGGTLPLGSPYGEGTRHGRTVPMAHAGRVSEPPPAPSQRAQSSGSAAEAVRGAQASMAAKHRAALRLRMGLNMALGALVAALILAVAYYLGIRSGQ